MATSTSVLNFWNSSDVTRIVKHALGEINQGDTLRRCSLKNAIIDLNTKGRFLLPLPAFPTRTYCIDQIPSQPDDGRNTYIPFRHCLGVVAELLTLFRTKVEQAHGQECWQRASMLFEDDPRSNMLFGLLRDVSAAPRSEAVNILERVSRKGLRLEQLGLTRARFRSRDCGLEALVRISTKMLVFLDHLKPADPTPVTVPSPVESSRVIVDSRAGKLVRLTYKGIPHELDDMVKEMFLILFWQDAKTATYEFLWKELIGGSYRQDPKGGGPPNYLRKIKGNLNRSLRDKFGPPPAGTFWVERVKGHGYRLNQKLLIWQVTKGAPDRSNELSIDPGQADRRDNKGYRR